MPGLRAKFDACGHLQVLSGFNSWSNRNFGMRDISMNRRNFAIGAAAAATAALLTPGEALGQAATTQGQAQSLPSPDLQKATKAAMAKLLPRARAEVEMKVAEIFRKYGDRLNEEQKADIRKVMAETQDGLEKMRAFALDNADQPAAVFQAYRAEGSR